MVSERHEKEYIDPHIGSQEYTHELAKPHKDVPAGSKLRIVGKERIEGKLHVHTINDATREPHTIPVSKIHKPGEAPVNKGHAYEIATFERLKKAGITPPDATHAGSTGGTDVTVVNKRKNTKHKGRISSDDNLLHGEVKEGVTAAMGQLTIHHTKEKGWHVGDAARKKRPLYAKAIEKSGILDHLNEHIPDPHKAETTASGRAKTIEIKHKNMDPAKAYLSDHHVHVVQVGGYGTYRVGKKDETGHGLPEITGNGLWRIREKQKGNKSARTIAFHPDGKKGLNKSHVDLDNDEHLFAFKKTLGFKD